MTAFSVHRFLISYKLNICCTLPAHQYIKVFYWLIDWSSWRHTCDVHFVQVDKTKDASTPRDLFPYVLSHASLFILFRSSSFPLTSCISHSSTSGPPAGFRRLDNAEVQKGMGFRQTEWELSRKCKWNNWYFTAVGKKPSKELKIQTENHGRDAQRLMTMSGLSKQHGALSHDFCLLLCNSYNCVVSRRDWIKQSLKKVIYFISI